MRREMEAWVTDAAAALGIQIERLASNDAADVTNEVEANFVAGSPRVWWLDLKTPYVYYDSGSTCLSQVLPRSRGEVFFIPETDDGEPLPVFRVNAQDIEKLIGECTFFEYYVVDPEQAWLVAETEHDALIVCSGSESVLRRLSGGIVVNGEK